MSRPTIAQIQQAYVAFFGRPADFDGLQFWQNAPSVAAMHAGFANSVEYTAQFAGMTSSQIVNLVYRNLFGRDAEPAGLQFWSDHLQAGRITLSNVVLAVTAGAQATDLQTVNNRITAATNFSAALDTTAEMTGYQGPAAAANARAWLATITHATPAANLSGAAVDAAVAAASAAGQPPVAQNFTLGVGIDNIAGNALNNVINAPVVQNQFGQLVNTFETGDTVNGGAGVDTLNVVLTNSEGATTFFQAPAISAELNGVEIVTVRAQSMVHDRVNLSHIDAERHTGVRQYWSNNSRSDLQIEDVRERPENLLFGMRQTDPRNDLQQFGEDWTGLRVVGRSPSAASDFLVYFDPAQLAAGRDVANSSLTLTLVDNTPGAAQLANFPVNGVVFTLDGVRHDVQFGHAPTYAGVVANLRTALAAVPALADVTVTLNANNTITLTDPAGAAFTAVGFTWVDGVVPAAGQLQWGMAVGAAAVAEVPISTNIELDAVGRSARGGVIDIGSMAQGSGIEVFNVNVDRDSWLSGMVSLDNMGVGDHHLETVNLSSIGAKGDLTIGVNVPGAPGELDRRVQNGLIDVREVRNVAFAGDLRYGVRLTDDSIGRYLADAQGQVQFTYDGGAGNDNITVVDTSRDGALSDDGDFALQINLGAGDDRLNINVPNVDNTRIDGGTGNNTLAVGASHGTNAANTFKGFANFQTYEVEAFGNTEHDFTAMTGVNTVIVSSPIGADTKLTDVAAAAAVIISGRNQTLPSNNATNENQAFGAITIKGADATAADTTLRVTLENTARLDGELTVNDLIIQDDADATQIRTLELVSAGQRNTTNAIEDLSAARINTFTLSGTQDLTVNLTAAANSTAAPAARASLVVNGAALTGDLDLTITGAVLSAVDTGATSTATLTGTAGAADELTILGAGLTITTDTTVAGFETVRLVDTGGTVNLTNFSGVTLYDIVSTGAALTLSGMKGTERININTDGGAVDQSLTFKAAAQSATSVLDLEFRDANPSPENIGFSIAAQDFRTISLDLGGSAGVDTYTIALGLLDENGTTANPAGVFARTLTVIGGGDSGPLGNAGGVDRVELRNVTNVFSNIDLSGFVGHTILDVGLFADTILDRNVVISLNGYNAMLTEVEPLNNNIVTYRFTRDAVATTENWIITGFDAIGAAGNNVSNLSVLDLRALGVTGLAGLNIVDTVAGIGGDVVITSNTGLNFEIVLMGVEPGNLLNDNFIFA